MILSVLLVAGTLLTLFFVVVKIRNEEIKVADTVFWVLFAACLLVLAVFPQIAYSFAELLGFQAPINFVYLCVFFVLLIREFTVSVEMSKMKSKLAQLAQEQALGQYTENK